jgi:CRISPR type III-A-associated RAMP protein Csm5
MKLLRYRLTLEARSPVHVGSGETWAGDADFVVEQGPGGQRTARLIDAMRALDQLSDAEAASIRDGRVARAVGQAGRQTCTIAMLPVRGAGNVNVVRALARLSDGSPYLAGSAVKGAFRTAMLRRAIRAQRASTERDDLGRNPRYAARGLEEQAFAVRLPGREVPVPNRDINRLFRFSDFHPAGPARTAFVKMSAFRPGGTQAEIPIWTEAIEPGSRFTGTVTIEYGGDLWDAAIADGYPLPDNPFEAWAAEGRELARREADYFRPIDQRLAGWFDALVAPSAMPITLGWGGGWRTKTAGILMSPQMVGNLARHFGGDLERWTRSREFPATFPVTRKLAPAAGGLLVPPGWLTIAGLAPL